MITVVLFWLLSYCQIIGFKGVWFKIYYIKLWVCTTHKFFIRTYQKAPIVQHYIYNIIKTNNYIHISCTHIDKGKRYITSTPIADIIDSIDTYIVY